MMRRFFHTNCLLASGASSAEATDDKIVKQAAKRKYRHNDFVLIKGYPDSKVFPKRRMLLENKTTTASGFVTALVRNP
jgi:hypothetical protein